MGCCCAGEDETDGRPRKSKSPLDRKNVCCTDIIFLILFVAFWGGMVYIAVYCFMQGDALRLVYGYDTFGNTCNRQNNVELNFTSLSGQDTSGKTNVFFFDMDINFEKSLEICIKTCPNKEMKSLSEIKEFCDETGVNLCGYDVKTCADITKNPDKCPDHVYPSFSLLNRCVPDYLSNSTFNDVATKVLKAINADEFARKVLSDLYESWKEMLALCFISLGIGLLMVFVIRYIASVMVYVIIVVSALASIAGTVFLWWTWWDTKNDLDKQEELNVPLLDVDIRNETAFLVFAIVASVLTVILLLIIFVMISRLKLVIQLFHEAGKFFLNIPLLLIQPLWTFIVLMVFLVFWVAVLAYITTADDAIPNYDRSEVYVTVDYEERDPVRYMWWYHVVGLIWISEFILACQQMVIAGTVAEWYFTRDKSKMSCTVCKATSNVVMNHIGTLAFGSFIITLVKIPRLILMYIKKKTEKSTSELAKCCMKCCICCLWCLEQCLKFLNQNAYTITYMTGKSFCPAARQAFSVITNNILRVAAINSVGDFVLFLGKIGVMSATAAIGIIWFKDKDELHYYAMPVLLVCIFAFLIAHCFLTIYEMAVDTILLCFCEDCERYDGSPGREYFMSASLMVFVTNTSKSMRKSGKSTKTTKNEQIEFEESPGLKRKH